MWVDALSSYLTGCKTSPGGAEGRWSSTVHFIGKDILRFHAVLWPMFLAAAGTVSGYLVPESCVTNVTQGNPRRHASSLTDTGRWAR